MLGTLSSSSDDPILLLNQPNIVQEVRITNTKKTLKKRAPLLIPITPVTTSL